MVGASKILTVSYGTFSCTLEGFDEPFSTMKAIAEYFRDLAADDRYFGAEPPTPDAEMLHRIAEKEIDRRVESKISQNGVILRQAEIETPITTPAPTVAPMPDLTVPALAADPVSIPPAIAEPVSDEAVLAVADGTTTDAVHPPVPAVSDRVEAAPVFQTDAPDTVAADSDARDDSIAAKLMRIRAVVESVRATPHAVDDLDYEEDEVAPAVADHPTDFGFELDLSNNMPELEAAETARAEARATEATGDADKATDAPTAVAETLDDDRDLLARLSQLGAETRIDPTPDTIETAAETKPAKPKSAAPWYVSDDHDDDDEDDIAQLAAATEHDETTAQPSLFQRARARVMRLGQAVSHSPDSVPVDKEPASTMESDHAAEDDWAYDEDRVAADDDAAAHEDPDLSRLMAEAKSKIEGPENRRRFSAISHLKAAVAATLADRQLRPDSARPDSASESSEIDLYREDLSKVVRPHSQSAVDSVLTSEHTPAPAGNTPAPLILVSEQRVDTPAITASSDAIRPRRVTVASISYNDEEEDDMDDQAEPSPEDVSSFAEFAEKLGAHSLTELLEAAAAYTASVEGRTSFSRPHLLRKVEFVSTRGAFNREDGMRSFGMLLREGKIQKVSHGQFAITGSSKFLSAARKAI